jgi:hypothetical protein
MEKDKVKLGDNPFGACLTNKKYQIIVEKFDDLKDKNG